MARSERTAGLRTADMALRVILCLGCLPTAHAFTDSGIGELIPHDPFVFVGENLTMECRLTKNLPGNLSIERNSVPLDSYQEKVGSHAIRLQYPAKHPDDSGLFVCWLHSFDKEKRPVGIQHVYIDYPAGKVQNVTCIAPNWRNLTCSWDLPYHFRYPDNVSVKVTLSRGQKVNKCCDPVDETKTSATWSDEVEGTGFVWGHPYWVRVQVVYTTRDGRTFRKSVKQHVITRDIVKPSPVLEKRECSSTSTSIRVRLYHSDYRHNKMVHIQYSSQWNSSKWAEKKAAWPNKTTLREMKNSIGRDVEMSGLQPYTVYTVRVAVGAGQGSAGGHLSDWRTYTLHTQPAAPDVAPQLCAGCYTAVSCDKPSQPCFVRLYWKSIPRPLRNGIISGYYLEVVSEDGATQSTGPAPGSEGSTFHPRDLTAQPGKDAPNPARPAHITSELGDCVPQPEDESERPQPGGGRSRLTSSSSVSSAVCAKPEVGDVRLMTETSHLLSLNGSEGSSVRLFAVNSNNQWSRDCSRLFIPSVHDRPAGAEDLVVEINDGPWNGRFYLRWTDPGPRTAFFTVVWCPGDSSTHTCFKGEDIQWQRVSDPSYNISVENDGNHDPKFMIGVARHQRRQQGHGDVSSGIIWTSCLYVRNRVPRVPEIERLTGTGSEGQLSLWWNYKLCDSKSHENVYITHFLVHYCRVSPRDSSCDGAEKSVRMSREKREAVLAGLERGRPYRVRMVAVSSWGQSRSSKEAVAVAPAERNVENAGSMLAVVIPCALAVAVVGCICCAVCKVRNHYKKTSGKFAKRLDGKESGQCTDSPKMAFHEREQVGNTSMLHGPRKQISVNSETPLLTVDDVILEEGEGGLDGLHSHPVRNDGLVSGILDEQRQRSTSALGSESVTQFRRPDGNVEEAAGKTITGFGVNDRKGIQHARQTCTAAVHVNSKIRNAYVSEGQASATVCPVLLEADGGATMMTSSTSLPGEVPANATQSTGENQVELACEEIDMSAPLVCVQENILTSDELKSTESLEQPCVEFSELVSGQRTAAQASSAESCHFVHGEHGSMTFSCGGQEQSESSTNAYTRLELDALSKLSEHSVMGVSDTESLITEGASLTHTPVDSDLDEEAVPAPDMCTTIPGDDVYLAQREGRLWDNEGVVQSSENMDPTIKTDASLKVSCKDSGGCVFVSSRPISPSPDSALSCCLTLEEAMHVPSRTSSTESLCTEDQIFVAVQDSTVPKQQHLTEPAVEHGGYIFRTTEDCMPRKHQSLPSQAPRTILSPSVPDSRESMIANSGVQNGVSPVRCTDLPTQGQGYNGIRTLSVEGTGDTESPFLDCDVSHTTQSPLKYDDTENMTQPCATGEVEYNGYVAHDGESPVVNG